MLLEWEIGASRQVFRLPTDGHAVVGRQAGSDVVLNDPTVSRQHAELYSVRGAFYVRNLSQSNPIFVVGPSETLRLEFGQVAVIAAGTRLQLGQASLEVRRGPVSLKLRCSGPCGKVVDASRSGFCPNCGTALATAETFAG
ncbi:MAG: FHA domain-containing protein [Chloroflexi bacterium]|nr:FHA domain-containing protein [Chloroflexota bacterium]